MNKKVEQELSQSTLGKKSNPVPEYGNARLVSITRQTSKRNTPIFGQDIWTAYELLYLDPQGRPQSACCQITIDCHSPKLIESKSMKEYLNSFYNQKISSQDALITELVTQFSAYCETPVNVQLFPANHPWKTLDKHITCIDEYMPPPTSNPTLTTKKNQVSETIYTNTFRSLCPVTQQPDIASIVIEYSGHQLNYPNLLNYLHSFYNHQGFHESCIEDIFLTIQSLDKFNSLTVQGLFNRRGGIDINPIRSTQEKLPNFNRHPRQ